MCQPCGRASVCLSVCLCRQQLREALKVAPEERALSAVLMVAQWLVEFSDLGLDGVPRRNLMAIARAVRPPPRVPRHATMRPPKSFAPSPVPVPRFSRG